MSLEEDRDNKLVLKWTNNYARENSTCYKVQVGSSYRNGNMKLYTCNRNTEGYSCKDRQECYKAKVTGQFQSSEETRKYCKATHSEPLMIELLKSQYPDEDVSQGTLYVTRFPCLNCARQIVDYGFKRVIYGGEQEVSDEVKDVFDKAGVYLKHYPDVDYEDHKKNGYEIRK